MLIFQVWNSSKEIENDVKYENKIRDSIDGKPCGRKISAEKSDVDGQNENLEEENRDDDHIPIKPTKRRTFYEN